MSTRRIAALVILLLASTDLLRAQTPLGTGFTYQGRLNDDGSPANGTYDVQFALFDAMIGGAQQGPTICVDNVDVADGLITVQLDFGSQFNSEARFLEIALRADGGFNCINPAGYVTLSPRQALTATPHALFSMNADKLDGLNSSAFLQSIPVPLTLSGLSSTHIIRGENTRNTYQATGVHGKSSASSESTYGVCGENSSTGGDGVYGFASATTGYANGVAGRSDSTSGSGVYGYASAATGYTYGFYGVNNSTSGCGVRGIAAASTGDTFGVWGSTNSVDGAGVAGTAYASSGDCWGVFGQSASTSGFGVYGQATASSGSAYGGYFTSASTSGRGVYGFATAGTGTTYGVFGQSAGTDGRGVYGVATATSGSTFGGYFESNSTSGYGVYGRNSATSGTIYGVRGYASTAASGYAVYAAGDMGASGAKPFRIDHPMDPENKYLLHYATESPEVINFYRGTATLNSKGEAVVELPEYFAMINRMPSYQLTAVGAPMSNLHVAEEISEEALAAGEQAGPGHAVPVCSFRIAGGVPGGKVCWRVEAVRNDLRMRLHGAPVERDKLGPERGKYQHPEYYGLPPEMGMDHDTTRQPEPAKDESEWREPTASATGHRAEAAPR